MLTAGATCLSIKSSIMFSWCVS